MAEVAELAIKYKKKKISPIDLSAMVLAKDLGVLLLTGDGNLREAALEEGIQIHGLLWLVNEMVERNALEPQEAIGALQKMLNKGARLPSRECEEYIRRWKSMLK